MRSTSLFRIDFVEEAKVLRYQYLQVKNVFTKSVEPDCQLLCYSVLQTGDRDFIFSWESWQYWSTHNFLRSNSTPYWATPSTIELHLISVELELSSLSYMHTYWATPLSIELHPLIRYWAPITHSQCYWATSIPSVLQHPYTSPSYTPFPSPTPIPAYYI